MAVERFLGGAWASVHGPTEPRGLLVWTLDQGFRGVIPAATPRPVDWAGMQRAARDLPVALPAVRLGSVLTAEGRADAGLASTHAGERAAAVAAVAGAIRAARQLGTGRVLLEPGIARVPGEIGAVDLGDPAVGWTADRARAQLARRNAVLNAALDAVCRALHGLCREFPDVELALTGSRHVFGLGEARALAAIFEDLAGKRLTYWHDAAVAGRRAELLGSAPVDGLESFANLLSGMTLGDSAEGGLYLPPGAGGVDYPLLATYRTRRAGAFPVIVELDPAVDPGEIPGVHAFLAKTGL